MGCRGKGGGGNTGQQGVGGAGGSRGGGVGGFIAARGPNQGWRPALTTVHAGFARLQLPQSLCPDSKELFRAAKAKLDPLSCVNVSLLGKPCNVRGCRFAHETAEELAARIVASLRQQAGPGDPHSR